MPNPRRFVLVPPLLCALVLSVTAATCAQAPAEPLFTLKHIGPNVWAAIDGPDAKWRAGANAGFVIGDDGVVVIDTFVSADAAKRLLAEIRQRTTLPIRFVVNTHHHPDHVAGNGTFRAAGAVILAQRNVRGWIHAENLRLASEGMRSQGLDITREQRTFIEGLVPPMMVYDNAVDLYLGSREVHVRSFPGHTGGDSVVLIPDAKIVFCGDLLWRHMVPSLDDASATPWVETLDVLSKTGPGHTFVPGHGDVGTAEDMWAFREYLVTLRTLVSDAQAQGKAGDALFEAVMPPLTEQYGHWDFFKEKAKSNIVETDAELRGKKRTPQAAMEK